MSSGQSLRNGSSVEPGLPNTRLMPNARSRPKVASLTVVVAVAGVAGLRGDIRGLPELTAYSVIARSGATKQSILLARVDGFLRLARNDRENYHVAVPFIG